MRRDKIKKTEGPFPIWFYLVMLNPVTASVAKTPLRKVVHHHRPANLCVDNVGPIRDVETVEELSDILVTDSADLLDVGSTL